jgi:hypothetical protein
LWKRSNKNLQKVLHSPLFTKVFAMLRFGMTSAAPKPEAPFAVTTTVYLFETGVFPVFEEKACGFRPAGVVLELAARTVQVRDRSDKAA